MSSYQAGVFVYPENWQPFNAKKLIWERKNWATEDTKIDLPKTRDKIVLCII